MNFFLFIPAYVWLFISALFFAAGEFLSKKWGMKPSLGFAFVVAIPYALGVFAWLPALLHKNSLSTMGTAWTLLSALATIGIGLFVFHESLSILNWVGLVLALAALVLLQV